MIQGKQRDVFHLSKDESYDYPKEGWYHLDEYEQLHGPYATEHAADVALKLYCEYL